MHEKVKFTDIQVSLGHVVTLVFGLGGAILTIIGVLLALGNLVWVDKKEFGCHKDENLKTAVIVDQDHTRINRIMGLEK